MKKHLEAVLKRYEKTVSCAKRRTKRPRLESRRFDHQKRDTLSGIPVFMITTRGSDGSGGKDYAFTGSFFPKSFFTPCTATVTPSTNSATAKLPCSRRHLRQAFYDLYNTFSTSPGMDCSPWVLASVPSRARRFPRI